VDSKGRVTSESVGHQIRGKALPGTPGIDADAGRPGHDPGLGIDLDLAPARGRPRTCGAPRWRGRERVRNRRGPEIGAGARVADLLELPDQGGVDEAIRAASGPERSFDRHCQSRAHQQVRPGIRVDRRELTPAIESAELAVKETQKELELDPLRVRRGQSLAE